jgi:hypothetical protein
MASADRPGGDNAKFMSGLNEFCRITQTVKADATIPDKEKPRAIVKRLRDADPPPELLVFLAGLSDAGAGKKYGAMKRAAGERGAPAWQCPALDE